MTLWGKSNPLPSSSHASYPRGYPCSLSPPCICLCPPRSPLRCVLHPLSLHHANPLIHSARRSVTNFYSSLTGITVEWTPFRWCLLFVTQISWGCTVAVSCQRSYWLIIRVLSPLSGDKPSQDLCEVRVGYWPSTSCGGLQRGFLTPVRGKKKKKWNITDILEVWWTKNGISMDLSCLVNQNEIPLPFPVNKPIWH